MNQQRARRFRAVKDAKERQQMMDEVLEEIKELGLFSQPRTGSDWDSNVITPGTDFMYNLSSYIRFYILDRMNKYESWRKIKVIFSDANEPGEGEHKIMRFIRSQRHLSDYDPNQRHILHGLDADLIMLALATHEVNLFSLIYMTSIITHIILVIVINSHILQFYENLSFLVKKKKKTNHRKVNNY
jgi:5'-3' exoribonuclease 2